MIDLLMLILFAVAFFGGGGYVRVCERLTAAPNHPDKASK